MNEYYLRELRKKNEKEIRMIFIFFILIIFISIIIYYHSEIKENLLFYEYLLRIKLNLYIE